MRDRICEDVMWSRATNVKAGTQMSLFCIGRKEGECCEIESKQEKWHQRNEEGCVAPLKALVRSDLEKVQEERETKGMMVSQM